MNNYFLIYLIVALTMAVSLGVALFYGYRAITLNKDISPKAPLASAVGAFPTWLLLSLYLILSRPGLTQLAIDYFGGNGLVFATMLAIVLSLFQFELLRFFVRK